ncbi:MAG: glycosyltransferase [Ginsengibacter sp.]
MTLSVVIVNFNVKYFLETCLLSVQKAMQNIDGEILVIDNCSTDGSRDFFKNRFADVNFFWNQQNTGFAKANNEAIKISKGEYILFLNPDTVVPEDCFEKCLAFIKQHDNNVALGIRMIDGSGNFLKESKRAFPDPLTSFFKLSGLANLFPKSKTFARYHLGHLKENENHEADVLAGAFIMVPKYILEKVGFFDENFFMYGEDIDLSFRIQERGFKNYYFAESSILHFKGESTRKQSINYVKMFYKAMSVFVKKHYGKSRAGVFNFFIQVAIFIRAGLALLRQFIGWIGLPVLDILILLTSFYCVSQFWAKYIKSDVVYSSHLLWMAFPGFTLIFTISFWVAGLYDLGYKQTRLNKAAMISILIILSLYSLLPESFRFSRGILVVGSFTAFGLMTLLRIILVKANVIAQIPPENKVSQTLVVASEVDFKNLLRRYPAKEKGTYLLKEPTKEASNWLNLVHQYGIKDIIFCEGKISFKTIIYYFQLIPKDVKVRLFADGSHAMLGSNHENNENIKLGNENWRLNNPIYCRTKTIFDISFAILILLTFPIHLFLKKNATGLFKNCFEILSGKKTWVGYALPEPSLPLLKRGVITTTSLPAYKNNLPEINLHAKDRLYANYYHIFIDMNLVKMGYKYLSIIDNAKS